MVNLIRTALIMMTVLTLVTGIAYPLLVTGIAQVFFPQAANGSLIERDGRVRGSALIGQPFSDPRYVWGRLSATSPSPYNALASGGSNVGPLNPALIEAARGRVDALRAADAGNDRPVPVDLVTASASGLDPHVSPAAARFQAARIARARKMDPAAVERLIDDYSEGRFLGILGEARVNVLMLNLALDALR